MMMEVNKPYYAARHVSLDTRFLPLIPSGYVIHRRDGRRWERIDSFDRCSVIDDVFMVPEEKLSLLPYRLFAR